MDGPEYYKAAKGHLTVGEASQDESESAKLNGRPIALAVMRSS